MLYLGSRVAHAPVVCRSLMQTGSFLHFTSTGLRLGGKHLHLLSSLTSPRKPALGQEVKMSAPSFS